jgi:hypothetical protein
MSKTVRKSITYFTSKGRQNTEALMEVVAERLKEGDIEAVVVATTSGSTALKAGEMLPKGTRVIGANFQAAYWNRHPSPDAAIRKKAEALGVKFMPEQPTAKYLNEISESIPDTLRRMGQGMKVAVEVTMQAVEVGFVAKGAKVIGVGGTSKGADVAVVVEAAGSSDFSSIWVSEILAKPL